MITVRRAEIKDIPLIMQFLDDNWLKGYALAHNRELFEWQFINSGKINVWIGIDDTEGKVYAMEGKIKYSSGSKADYSGILWITKKTDNPVLAFEVQDAMCYGEIAGAESETGKGYTLGLTSDALKVLRRLKQNVGTFDHYYRLADKKMYGIAVVKNKVIRKVEDRGCSVTEFSDFEIFKSCVTEDELLRNAPAKDYQYIHWRYWEHPVFKYNKWLVKDSNDIEVGVMITREEYYGELKACKIVDYYGDITYIGKITNQLDIIMQNKQYEFIDVYSYGVNTDIYNGAGFEHCDLNSENIIPNFFQPYSPQNSDIYCIIPEAKNARLFRGDSDQDKPRLS